MTKQQWPWLRRDAIMLVLAGSLAVSASAGPLKKAVVVMPFENKTSSEEAGKLADGITAQLAEALSKSPQILVLERPEGEAKVANAQVVIQGSLAAFESKTSEPSGGFNIGGVKLGNKRQEAIVSLTLQLVDNLTGRVIDSKKIDGRVDSKSLGVDVSVPLLDLNNQDFKSSPLGKATQTAVDNAVRYLLERLKKVPFQGRVIKVTEEDVYVSAGKATGAAVDDVFTIVSVGEALVDPTTGEQLGADEKKLGTIKVYQVEEKYSKAKPEAPLEGVKPGDFVRGN